MAVFTGVNVGGSSPEELTDAVIGLNRTLEFQMANLDSDNVREIGGWRVGPTQLTSKDLDVGLSTDDSQLENIRFWAGSATNDSAPFRVYDSGRVVASNIDITGGNITWGNVKAPNYNDLFGDKPPLDANNTYSELLYNSGIRGFVNVGGTLFISADYIRAGTITGINIETAAQAGRRVVLSSTNNLVTAYASDTDYVQMNAFYSAESHATLSFVKGAQRADMLQDGSQLFLKSSNHIVIAPGGFYGTTYMRGIVDFTGATTIQGLTVTAKFG